MCQTELATFVTIIIIILFHVYHYISSSSHSIIDFILSGSMKLQVKFTLHCCVWLPAKHYIGGIVSSYLFCFTFAVLCNVWEVFVKKYIVKVQERMMTLLICSHLLLN